MKILVLGAGSMGLFFGARLGKEMPAFLERDEEKCAYIAEKGYRLEMEGEETWIHPQISSKPGDFTPPDLLLLMVKTYDTIEALTSAQSLIGPDTYVMTLQNGLGNVEKIAGFAKKDHIIAGTTTHGAYAYEKNQLRYTGGGEIIAGYPCGGDDAFLAKVAKIFSDCGLPIKPEQQINHALWTKTLVNAAINPLTALMGIKNGALLQDPELLFFMEKILEEGAYVAEREGVTLLHPDIFSYTKTVAAKTGANYSSMLMDIQRGNPTEICAINGEICRRGVRLGINLPYNMLMQDLILALEGKKCYTSD